MQSINQTFKNKKLCRKILFMKKLKSEFRISCKSYSDTADLQAQSQSPCIKKATNLGDFCVH